MATARYADATLQQLRAPSRDAEELSAVLGDPGIGGFTVTQMIDWSSYELRVGIERYLRGRSGDDLLVVYLSCHGILDRRGRLYFAATDTDRETLSATGVAAGWLLEQLDECPADQQVVILDCCFSGAFDPRAKGHTELSLNQLTGNGRGRAVLTASRHYEYSFEGESLDGDPSASVFTAGLIEGLNSGQADLSHKGFISVDDAYDFAYRYVQEQGADQTPQRWLYGGEGKIWLARNPAGQTVVPADLPDDLRHAVESRYPAMRLSAVEVLAEWLADPDPARRLTAAAQLKEIAESDIPRVAEGARRALRMQGADGDPLTVDPRVVAAGVVPEPAASEPVKPEPLEPEPEPAEHPADPVPVDPVHRRGARPFIGYVEGRPWLAALMTAVVLIAGTLAAALLHTKGDDGNPGSKPSALSQARGGVLRMMSSFNADSFDPARSYYSWMWNFQRSFFARTLLTYAAQAGPATLVPDLAQDLPVVSADGKKYTFKLKAGLKFEDGSPIRSADIKYGIERVFDQDKLGGGPTYLKESLANGQNYLGPATDKDAAKLGLKSVQTPADDIIVFTLARPIFDFMDYLAMPSGAPVPRKKDTGAAYGNHPISSGPYKFQTDTTAATVTMVRNDHWDRATDDVRLALPDTIQLTEDKTAAKVDAALLAKEIDIDAGQIGVQPGTLTTIEADATLKGFTTSAPTSIIRFFALNTTVQPFGDVHCRIAVHYAIDKLGLQTSLGGKKRADIATAILPPTVPGFDAGRDPYRTKSGQPQISRAKTELAACKHPTGFTTKIMTRDNDTAISVSMSLRDALAKVGIAATVVPVKSDQFWARAGAPATAAEEGYGIVNAVWSPDCPTALNVLEPLTDGRIAAASFSTNLSHLNSPSVNALLDRMSAARPGDLQTETSLAAQLDQAVMNEAALVPFAAERATNFHHPRLKNVVVSSAYGMIDFARLGVA